MASTFLDEKISSFIEDKFPEFVKNDHPVFVEFLREYYKFLEAAKLTLKDVRGTDQLLLENKLTTNYLVNERDDTRIVYEDSTYGAYLKDETVVGQTSGATSTVLSENNTEGYLYIEANRHFIVGEVVVGSTSNATGTIDKYQGNPVQNIQQLLEYVNIDTTVNDYLDHFRDSYLTAIPNTLAAGVSKRKLVKSVRDLYRAKGSKKGHEAFFRLMFDETPELIYPTENILKVSAGDWSSDTVIRVVATENNPANWVGQTVTQTVNVGLGHAVATAAVESILQLQEGETTVYQLILNVASIDGTFVAGAEVSGIDNTDIDTSITATVQSILVGATVTEGSAGYTIEDTVAVSSASGKDALISIVDVGSGEVDQIIIDNPGTGYTIGDPIYFDNTNTEGSGASAIVSCIGGAIAPETGDVTSHTVTGNVTNNSSTITNITTTSLYEARQFELFGKLSVGSTTITNISTDKLVIGSTIEGTGIPTNTTIVSIDTVGVAENGIITVSNAITHGGISGSVTSIARSSATATVTTSSAHGLISGDMVTIAGATPTAYNGEKSITVTSTTQFTYTIDSSASTPAGGTKTFELSGGIRTRQLTHLEEGTGQIITGTGIPALATIRKITISGSSNNGTIILSHPATQDGSGRTLTIPSEYGINDFDHIVFDEAAEATDAYTGNQIQLEKGVFATSWQRDLTNEFVGSDGSTLLSVAPYDTNNGHNIPLAYSSEFGEVVNVTMFSKGSGYEVMPTITPATTNLFFNANALDTSGDFSAGEVISNDASPAVTAIITTLIPGKIAIAKPTGSFAQGQVITGSQSNAVATLTVVTPLGANATYLGYSTSGIGSISGIEVTKFGTGFAVAPTATVPVKMLLTRNTNESTPVDISLATAFSVGDTIIGQTSSARGTVTSWDNIRQVLTAKTTQGTFQRSEILTRGSGTDYAIVAEISQGSLSTTIGTLGTTAGGFINDKGKISESLMKVQDSYYYQDFSYVVKVGAAIADWRSEIKKAVHPAGFAMFGEVSISNKVATLMTVPVTGITSYTPTLASLFEAVLTTVIGRRLGTEGVSTNLTTTAVPQATPVQYQRIGNCSNNSASITNITTTDLAVGQIIYGVSLSSGTTITTINTASSGNHNNGTITISQVATATTSGEWFTISVPYTTEYSIASSLLGETEMKGTTNHAKGTLKRGNHLGHEPQLSSIVESITRSGTTATVETNGPHGVEAGEQVEITGVTSVGYNGVHDVVSVIGDDSFTITVANTLTTPATVGEGKVKLLSPFDNSTRDLTLRKHTDIVINPIYGGWATNQRSRYGLGPRQSNAIKYMWATPPTEYAGSTTTGITENHQTLLESSSAHNDEFLMLETEVLPSVDYTVTVANSKFVIDGVSQSALELDGDRHYRFDLSDSSVSGHSFTFSKLSDGGGVDDEYNEEMIEGEGSFALEIELESGSYTEYSLLSGTRWNLIAEDGAGLLVNTYSRVFTQGTAGTAGAYLDIFTENVLHDLYYYCTTHSGMGSSSTITPRIGGYILNETYQLGGEAAVENILLEDGGYILYEIDTDPETQSVMVSEASTIVYASVTEDMPNRLEDQMAYAYPNITRRESPESGTDNVDAGSAGVYDTTMNYTNIKIWDHESNVHNRISDFADIRIVDIIKCGREFLEIGEQPNKHEGDNDYYFTIMEDGSHIQMESGSAGIPLTSRKIWNVPPPSYVRLSTS